MEDKLYELCDWAEIEAIVYSEHDNPHKVLGAHVTEDGVLINTFQPTAKEVSVFIEKTEKEYKMEQVDEAGFFAVLIPGKRIQPYTYRIIYDNETQQTIYDPYSFQPVIQETDLNKFAEGTHYTVYEKLGSHVIELNGVKGTVFAVWAPNALRVSVVGDFNLWDGRRHLMRRLGDSGIFELFIPDISDGELYKYEVKVKGGLNVLKADPYGNYSEMRPNTASVVFDLNHYKWKDDKWMEKRKKADMEKEPVLIYEVHLGSWRKPADGREFLNYREIAPMLAEYIKDLGYTHIELMPIMEHPLDASWGYQVTGYYAATSRYGTPEDFMYFMDYMHQKGIGVILDWVPAHFPKDVFGLANFDGTCLYEHKDPRQGYHPHWGTLIYNYGRPQVSNFLIANALFWVDKYHADAIRMDAVASMLYLDYGKQNGEWVANKNGGNENLEAIELLKQLSTVFHKRKDGALLIAEESTAWPKVTGTVKDDGLGFDYKWNMGWMNDFTNYLKCDPLFRKGHHGELTFSIVYAYSEKFVLVLSHDEVVHGKASMIYKMPGEMNQKFDNLRTAFGFMMAHPGKKLLFMGQEFAQLKEWNENEGLSWELLSEEKHMQMKNYVKALNRFYSQHPAMYQEDYETEGFEWINSQDAERSIVSFLRKTSKKEETLLVVCNFTPVEYTDYKVGVPFQGKYKEIFNSDKLEFGGNDSKNARIKMSRQEEADSREQMIEITVPSMGFTVFSCTPAEEPKKSRKTAPKTEKTQTRKSSASKKAPDTETVKEEPQKAAAVIEEQKKVATAKVEPKKVETTKEEQKKVATSKKDVKKVETAKEEQKKVASVKVEPKKVATAKEEQKKVATTKEEQKKVGTTKKEPKKIEDIKEEAGRESKSTAVKKAGTSRKKTAKKDTVLNDEEKAAKKNSRKRTAKKTGEAETE